MHQVNRMEKKYAITDNLVARGRKTIKPPYFHQKSLAAYFALDKQHEATTTVLSIILDYSATIHTHSSTFMSVRQKLNNF